MTTIGDLKDPFGIIDGDPGDVGDVPAPSDAELSVLRPIEDAYAEAKAAHDERKALIDYCTLMLKGETLTAVLQNSSEVLRVVVDGAPQRARSTDNKLRAADRAFKAKLIKIVPSVRSRPRTTDREDVITAEIEDSFLDAMWHSMKLRLKYKRWVSWIPRAGAGVLQLVWNADKGGKIAVCTSCGYAGKPPLAKAGKPCPQCALVAQQQMEETAAAAGPVGLGPGGAPMPPEQPQMPAIPVLRAAREGDLDTLVIDPHEFFPDPSSTSMEDMQYAFVSKVLPVSTIRRMFPEKWQLIREEDGLHADRYLATSYSTGAKRARVETKILRRHARLTTYYELPSAKYRRGRIVSYACGRLLETKDNIPAYKLGRLPFYLATGDLDDGEFWPEPIILQAEGLQRERDELMTQKRHHRQQIINPPWVVSWSSGIDADFMDRTPGKILKVKPSAMDPKQVKPNQMPSYIETETADLAASIYEKFGVTPHELGQTQSGDSGRFAAFLETQAQSVVAAMLIEIYAEWLEFHRGIITLGRYYYPPDRVWTTTGEDQTRLVTRSWSNAEGRSGDVYLVEDDAMSKNPIMRMNQTLDLKKQVPELFMDESTGQFQKKEFKRMAGLQLETLAADAESEEHTYAAKIPEMIQLYMKGEGPPFMPKSFDDVWVVIEELRKWLQTRGRNAADQAWVAEVEKVWHYYVQQVLPDDPKAMIDPMLAKLLPNAKLAGLVGRPPPPGQGGQQASMGAGGQPNVMSGVATVSTPTPNQEVAGRISQSDKSAERVARGGAKHEG